MEGTCIASDGVTDSTYYYEEEVRVTVMPEGLEITEEYEIVDFVNDGRIDGIDVLAFAHHYPSAYGDPKTGRLYDRKFDIAKLVGGYVQLGVDGKIDILDLNMLSYYYGQGGGSRILTPEFSGTSSMDIRFDNAEFNKETLITTVQLISDRTFTRGSQIEVIYDPEVVEIVNVEEVAVDGETFFHYTDENGKLTITQVGLGYAGIISNRGAMATLKFRAKEDTEISFGEVITTDPELNIISVGKGNAYQISADGIFSLDIPTAFGLHQNYPNPFNPTTTIKFDMPMTSNVAINVYDATGKLVKTLVNEEKEAGYHQVVWEGKDNNGSEVPSGVYFYRIESEDFSKTHKMLLLK
jgi:hypothetical protein